MSDIRDVIVALVTAPPFIPELHQDDCDDVDCVRCEPTNPIERLDVPATAVEAHMHLRDLLAHPPLGHIEDPQPKDWYEHVFDDMAAAWEARQNQQPGGQS